MIRTCLAAGVAVVLLAGCQASPGESADSCAAPTTKDLQELASYAKLVVDVEVLSDVQLKRDETASNGHVVRVRSVHRGSLPGDSREIAVWSNPSTQIVAGRNMTLFLLPRNSATTKDGQTLSSFSPISGGALLVNQDADTFAKSCRNSESKAVNRSVLKSALG